MIHDGPKVDLNQSQDRAGELCLLDFILAGDGVFPVQAEAGVNRRQKHHAQSQGDQDFQQCITPAPRS